jgi:hypothetical protein
MMRTIQTRHVFLPVLACAAALFLAACNKSEDTTTAPQAVVVAGPSNLRAYSVDSTRVGLMWTVSVDEAKTELQSYALSVTDTFRTPATALTAVKGQTSLTVSGLTEGTIYIFTLKANVASGAVTNDSATVRWSPAKRMETEGAAPIQVFETADPSHPSGLDVYSSTVNGPVTRSLTGLTNSLIDVYVATLTTSQDLEVRSASLSTSIGTGKITTFSTETADVNDLNANPRPAPPDAATYSVLKVTVPSAAAATGRITWGKTQEGNYFRMLVVSNGTSLISGPTGQRFITVKLSYQSKAGVPYARPLIHEPDQD